MKADTDNTLTGHREYGTDASRSVRVERKVLYYYEDGKEIYDVHGNHAMARQWADLTRQVKKDPGTGRLVYGDWTEADFPPVKVLRLEGFVSDLEVVPGVYGVTPDDPPADVKVYFSPRGAKREFLGDIADADPLLEAAQWAVREGILETDDGKFNPNELTTREQAVLCIWKCFGRPAPVSAENPFKDVTDKTSDFYEAIIWASENNVVVTTKDRFYPQGHCTREQLITMIWRAAGSPVPTAPDPEFSDTSPLAYSYKATWWAAQEGIATGSNGKFFPLGICKKRETVTFLYRYFSKHSG